MLKHAIALGYFLLAVLCLDVSYSHEISILRNAALIAGALGCIFFFAATLSQLGLVSRYFKKLIEAAQPPAQASQNQTEPQKILR
jgi:tellurite resistance protein TehA-like permease